MLIDSRWFHLLVLLPVMALCGCAAMGPRQPASASLSDDTPNGEAEVRQASYDDSASPSVAQQTEESFWESASPLKLGTTIKKSYQDATGTGPNPELSKQLYAQAEAHYRQAVNAPPGERREHFLQAAEKYHEAAARWPDSALEQDGFYMAAESYFFADAYPDANEMYEVLIKKYPGTKYMDTIDARRYTIAQYWLELTNESPEYWFAWNMTDERRPWRDTRGHALRVYDKIRIDDPTGHLADDATLAAANARFLEGDYMRADEYYGDLRKAFPSSEHQFKAHFLGLKTKLLCYQGSAYSGDALDEAEKLIKQMRKQFPRESQEEHEFLARAYAEVRYKKAEREWDLAQYFVRRGEYGAARLYQNTIISEYEDTPFAERAREQLVKQAEYPDEPPKRMAWLVDLFPRERPAKPLFYSDEPPK